MSIETRTTFEVLPDEMILEVCRYLHCSHVLYAFFDLNSRLNQTITYYRQHVWFRRASYQQLVEIYKRIVPRLSTSILSLTIHPLHQASFPESIRDHFSTTFPRLQTLTLSSWSIGHLSSWIGPSLEGLMHLKKLVIEELSCSPAVSESEFLDQIFQLKNPSLTNVIFDYDCDAFDPLNLSQLTVQCDYLLELTIQLGSSADFVALIRFIPNIRRLNVTFKDSSLGKVSFKNTLPHLTHFSLWAFHWYSVFHDLPPFISIAPSMTDFTLILSTRDADFLNGEKLKAILPAGLKQFHYSVCYYSSDSSPLMDFKMIQKSWNSVPIVCSISSIDRRIFLHTSPYRATRLTIRSSLAKALPPAPHSTTYSNINQISVYSLEYLSDTFPLLNQCRRVRELFLLTPNERPMVSDISKRQRIELLPLHRLDILTIEGVPNDLSEIKEIFLAAPNLSALVIDIDCLLTIFENEDESLLLYALLHRRILDLCIRSPAVTSTNRSNRFTCENIHVISRVLNRVRNLTIDFENSSEPIDIPFIQTILDRFDQMVILHIYGRITNTIPRENLRQWFIEQNSLRFKETDIFRIECTDEWFKLWL